MQCPKYNIGKSSVNETFYRFKRSVSAIGKKSTPINTLPLNMCSHTSAALPAVSVDQSQPLHYT